MKSNIEIGQVVSDSDALAILRDGEVFNARQGEPIFWGDTLVNEGQSDVEILFRGKSPQVSDSVMVLSPQAQAKVQMAEGAFQSAGTTTLIDAGDGVEIHAVDDRPAGVAFVGDTPPDDGGLMSLFGVGLFGGGLGATGLAAAGTAALGVGLLAAGSQNKDDNLPSNTMPDPTPTPAPPTGPGDGGNTPTDPGNPNTPIQVAEGGLAGTLVQVAQSADQLTQDVPLLNQLVNGLTDALAGSSASSPGGLAVLLSQVGDQIEGASAGIPVLGELGQVVGGLLNGESLGVSGVLADLGQTLDGALAPTPLAPLGDGLHLVLQTVGGVLGTLGQGADTFTNNTPAAGLGDLLSSLLGTEPLPVASSASLGPVGGPPLNSLLTNLNS